MAVKILHRRGGRTQDARRRLRDEGRLLAYVRHPVVVQSLQILELDDRLALVTDFVPGRDLTSIIEHGPPMGLRAVLQLTAQVAAGLNAAWHAVDADGQRLRIVHRDVKPSNIRVGHHGQVRLLDFGIASFDDDDRQQTASDVVVGSMPYMAPERFTARDCGPEVDIYGLACCLYEALAGEAFHRHGQLREVSRLALDAEAYEAHLAARVEALPDELPDELRDLLCAGLASDRAARPDAQRVVERAERMADDLGGTTLRRWCGQVAWPSVSEVAGPLTGRPFPDQNHDRDSRSDAAGGSAEGPRWVEVAMETLEPAMIASGGGMAQHPDGTPKALPRPFPSIPYGNRRWRT